MIDGGPINQDRVRDASLQTFGERLARLEEQSKHAADARERNEQEIRDFRDEVGKRFDKVGTRLDSLNDKLEPFVTVMRAGRWATAALVALFALAMGGINLIEGLLRHLGNR